MNRDAKKKMYTLIILMVFVGGSVFAFALNFAGFGNDPNGNVIENDSDSPNVHWHATLRIVINDEPIPIPANIGVTIAGSHPSNLHTHEAGGNIHKEGPAGATLSSFFSSWRKTFSSECIFDFCNGEDGTVKFLVNGKPNDKFENYAFVDGDEMEIVFSKDV